MSMGITDQPWLSGQNTRFARSELWFQIPKESMVVTGRAANLNLFLSSNKVSLLTMEKLHDHVQGISGV